MQCTLQQVARWEVDCTWQQKGTGRPVLRCMDTQLVHQSVPREGLRTDCTFAEHMVLSSHRGIQPSFFLRNVAMYLRIANDEEHFGWPAQLHDGQGSCNWYMHSHSPQVLVSANEPSAEADCTNTSHWSLWKTGMLYSTN